MEVGKIKGRLKEMLLEESMRAVVRSKVGGEVEEEKASLYHTNREHKRGQRCNLLNLKAKRGNEEIILENEEEIEEKVLEFFLTFVQWQTWK